MKEKFCIVSIVVMLTIMALLALICLSSCNVTRTVTTSAQHYQRGDTTVTIMTKTTESYDGSIKPQNFVK